MLISLVYYIVLFSVGLALNISIYNSGDYNISNETKPLHVVEDKYSFGFNQKDTLKVDLRLKNKAPDIVAKVYITHQVYSNYNSAILQHTTHTSKTTTKCNNEDCVLIELTTDFFSVVMQLERGNIPCATQIILEGNATLASTTNTSIGRSYCSDQLLCYTVVIDVQNECQESTNRQQQPGPAPSSGSPLSAANHNIWIYVITSAIVFVICVIILALFIRTKKSRGQNTDAADTMELNTYSTNEVLYADLSFANGNCQKPKPVEESPYAKIIGVMKIVKEH